MIRLTRYEDKVQLKHIWKKVFGDEDAYIDGYFDNVFRPEYSWCYEDKGMVVAMLYSIPCRVCTSDNTMVEAFYFYALATLSEYRIQGIMGNMISTAVDSIEKMGCHNIFLIPASMKLIEYYQKYGFSTIYSLNGYNISEEVELHATSPERISELVGQHWKYTNVNIFFDKRVHDFYLHDIAGSEEFSLCEIVWEGIPSGYAICRVNDSIRIVCQYGTNDKTLADLIRPITAHSSRDKVVAAISGNDFLLLNGLIPV